MLLGLATIAVLVTVLVQPPKLDTLNGIALASIAVFLLPLLTLVSGSTHHLTQAKGVQFCGSCHIMEPYTRDLDRPSPLSLAGAHHQNQWLVEEQTCYICHTSYAMFGDLQAKWTGARHLWVYYTGQTPDPLELHRPFSNSDCLRCHGNSTNFNDLLPHRLLQDADSCLDCHGPGHQAQP
jgi:cytochrome c-type protein NapC